MIKYAISLFLICLCLQVSAQKQVEKLKEEYLLVFPVKEVIHIDEKETNRPSIKSVILNETHVVFHYLTERNGDIDLGVTVHKVLNIEEEKDPDFFVYTLDKQSHLTLILTDEEATIHFFINGKPKMTMKSVDYDFY